MFVLLQDQSNSLVYIHWQVDHVYAEVVLVYRWFTLTGGLPVGLVAREGGLGYDVDRVM